MVQMQGTDDNCKAVTYMKKKQTTKREKKNDRPTSYFFFVFIQFTH